MARPIGAEFMRKTRYPFLDEAERMRGINSQPPLQLPYAKGQALIPMPEPEGDAELRALIDQRRSIRRYAPDPLTMPQLSYLLWCTQGVQQVVPERVTRRTVPSAGSCHAFETYLLANRVDGLAPGLYRYLAMDKKLLPLEINDQVASDITTACLGQDVVRTSAATFLWVAVASRMTWRYGQRGYRFLHIDAGHVCQNLYLAAESIGFGVCSTGAFDDTALNTRLHLDGEELFVIYLATVGKKLSQ